jgi:hypothetical protein
MRDNDSHIVGRYVDAGGTTHELVVRNSDLGGWQALDVCAEAEHVIDTLIGGEDDRPQAEAVARDYLTAGRFVVAPGRGPGEAIPEQGGADAHSDRRPRSATRP